MSGVRKRGFEYFKKTFGVEPPDLVAVSSLIEAEKSWTRMPAWWFDLPIEKIRLELEKDYLLLGENRDGTFIALKVPNKFFQDNIANFDTEYKNSNGDYVLRLHLAAYPENWLTDERLKENQVSFRKFELK